jgi:hypothetical protein
LESHIKLLKLILPDFLVENFKLVSFENYKQKLHLYLEEEPTLVKELSCNELVPGEFTDEIIIEDFPLVSKLVSLHIKRLSWTNTVLNKIIKRDWTLIDKNELMTREFETFLKEINR